MKTSVLQRTWEELGSTDPLWAIISREEKKGGKWNVDEFFRTGEKEIADVMRYVDVLPVKIARRKALDFGCGVGRLTQPLAKYFNEVFGVDIAASMIALANQHNSHGGRCTYIHNTTGDLKIFADNCFDFIYTNITLQHMPPHLSKNYIKEFLRVLAPRGVLLFQLPSAIRVRNATGTLHLKALLLRVIPKFFFVAWYRVMHGRRPRIEMFRIRRNDVVKFLEDHGARIVDVVEDTSAGKEWVSFRYCVTKD